MLARIIPDHLAELNVARILSSRLDVISWQPVPTFDLFAHIVLRGSTAFVRKAPLLGELYVVLLYSAVLESGAGLLEVWASTRLLSPITPSSVLSTPACASISRRDSSPAAVPESTPRSLS
jgi:hypothetical protein